MTVQCDICCPASITTTTLSGIIESGWLLTTEGAGRDTCPSCARIHRNHGEAFRASWRTAEPAPDARLPNLIMIGAAKCGTTSMHEYLATHPDVFMASLKELRFFSDPDHREWLGHYMAQFHDSSKIVGESSTMYTRSPALPRVAERMADLVPDARLIYMVRDPVERALASYQEERFQGLDMRSPDEAFEDLDDPYNPYLSASRYAEQLTPFLERYSRDQILVLSLTDLRDDPQKTMRRAFEFLSVDPGHHVDTTVRHNLGSERFEYGSIGSRLRNSRIADALRQRSPDGPRRFIVGHSKRLLSKPLPRPTLDEGSLQRLADSLAPDAKRFRELVGHSFPDWTI